MFVIKILCPLISYIIGSISFGFLITKLIKGTDIRLEGSGNPGATNVARVLGKKYGVLVFILDLLKGFIPVFVFDRLFSGQEHYLILILCGLGVICGHTFPLFLRFKGGKAAATGCGVFLWLAPTPILISAAAWLLITVITRYVSLGSIISSFVLVVCVIFLNSASFGRELPLTLFSVFICVLLTIRHKSNILRILNGTENKIGKKAQ